VLLSEILLKRDSRNLSRPGSSEDENWGSECSLVELLIPISQYTQLMSTDFINGQWTVNFDWYYHDPLPPQNPQLIEVFIEQLTFSVSV
jgi:hypothetical protein